MNEAFFPLHVSHALDRLTVPVLPPSFADRLAVRIASGDLPDDSSVAELSLPVLRQPVGKSGWRRSGRILIVAAAFGLATATAAATGVFGDPVYIPVVSQALAKAQIVEMPSENPMSKKVVIVHETTNDTLALSVKPEISGKDKVIALIAEMRADPAYRNLARNERRERAKAEIAKLLADGTVQKADVKSAWVQLATERKAAVQARLDQGLPVPERRIIEANKRAKSLSPEQEKKVREAVKQLTAAQRAELHVLRQRRRDATPQERRAIQNEIRAFLERVGVMPAAKDASSGTP